MEFKIPTKLSELKLNNNVVNLDVKPTLCFACVCKNEEACIRVALESIYKFIDYWVICDTGSTDNTCNIITEFFEEKGIPGELFHEEWVNFGHNKTILFDKCYKKTDYIIHFDADDYFVGDLKFIPGHTQYHINVKKHSTNYPCLLIFSAQYHWRFCGVAHTTIRCLDCPNFSTGNLIKEDFYMYSTPDTGARSSDPDKFKKDAEKLRQQFFDTLIDDTDSLNGRSAFYTAQSYRDHHSLEESAKWYSLYLRLQDTWVEEQYMCNIELGNIFKALKYPDAEKKYLAAIDIFDDRAEAFFLLGLYYNQNKKSEKAYSILKRGLGIPFEKAKSKYFLFLNERQYGKYFLDELSVACYWTGRYDEGMGYLQSIILDPDFGYSRERLEFNLKHFKDKLSNN